MWNISHTSLKLAHTLQNIVYEMWNYTIKKSGVFAVQIPIIVLNRDKQRQIIVSNRNKQRPIIVSNRNKQRPIIVSNRQKQIPIIVSNRDKQSLNYFYLLFFIGKICSTSLNNILCLPSIFNSKIYIKGGPGPFFINN